MVRNPFLLTQYSILIYRRQVFFEKILDILFPILFPRQKECDSDIHQNFPA